MTNINKSKQTQTDKGMFYRDQVSYVGPKNKLHKFRIETCAKRSFRRQDLGSGGLCGPEILLMPGSPYWTSVHPHLDALSTDC